MKSKFTERKQSSIINLRTFHNWTKKELLNQTCEIIKAETDDNITLLDLSCGKGGDMFKWYKNNIMEVVGFDIDEDSIKEAKTRYQQMVNDLTKNRQRIPKYTFYVMDLSDKNNLPAIAKILTTKKFSIVSCQFAIHYFFKNEDSLKNLITITSTYISNHGYFIGTTMDGEMIKYKLHDQPIIGNDIYTIEKQHNDSTSPYNNTILVSLGEAKDTEHYFANKKSEEFLVDINELKNICAKYNLVFVGTINFQTWYERYKQNIMSNNEMEYSFLNFSFVFKKIIV